MCSFLLFCAHGLRCIMCLILVYKHVLPILQIQDCIAMVALYQIIVADCPFVYGKLISHLHRRQIICSAYNMIQHNFV